MQNRDKRGRFIKGHSLNFGKKLPKEVKNKISETLKKSYREGRIISWKKGRKTPESVRRKISESEKGKKISEETKKKMSEAKQGINFSERHRRNLSEARKGMKFSKEHRKCLSEAHKDKALSEEHKIKISKAHLKRWDTIGRKIYKRLHRLNGNRKYKEWRRAVFERDTYICQICLKPSHYLEAHHIKLWAMYPKLRYKADNGITLCKKCHKLINSQPWLNNLLLTRKNVSVAEFAWLLVKALLN